MDSKSSDQLKLSCPDCGGKGAAHMVTMRSQERVITYRCNACNNTWIVTDPSPLHGLFSQQPSP